MEYLRYIADKDISSENLLEMVKYLTEGKSVKSYDGWGIETPYTFISDDLYLRMDINTDSNSCEYIFTIIYAGAILMQGWIEIFCESGEHEGHDICYYGVDTKSLISEITLFPDDFNVLLAKYTKNRPLFRNCTNFKVLFDETR